MAIAVKKKCVQKIKPVGMKEMQFFYYFTSISCKELFSFVLKTLTQSKYETFILGREIYTVSIIETLCVSGIYCIFVNFYSPKNFPRTKQVNSIH